MTIVNFLFYSICALLSLGQIGRFSFSGQQINGYLYEVPLFVLTVLLVMIYKSEPILSIREKLPSLLFFIGYLLFTFIVTTFFYSVQTNTIAMLYLLRLILYFTFFSYFYYYIQKQLTNRVLNTGLVICCSATIVFSLIQYYLYPNLRNISYLGWDPHWYRMVGTFLDPPITGAVYGLLFISLLSYRYFFGAVRYVVLGALLLFLFLTYSRGSFAAFSITILTMFMQKKWLLGAAVCAAVFIGIVYLLPHPFGESVNLLRTFSIYSRLENYTEAAKDWSKSPVFGVGYNRIRYTRDKSTFSDQKDLQNNHAGASYHSSFLIIIVTGGVVGLLLFIWLLVSIAQFSPTALWSTVFLSLLSLTDNVLLHPFVLILYLIIVAGSRVKISPSHTQS
ncbi:MAG: O-antigen ligase family protein [Patescibacteria group bacterium]